MTEHLQPEERTQLESIVHEMYLAIADIGRLNEGAATGKELRGKHDVAYDHLAKAMARMIVLGFRMEARLPAVELRVVPERDLEQIGGDVVDMARMMGMRVLVVDEEGVHDDHGTVTKFAPPGGGEDAHLEGDYEDRHGDPDAE